MDRCISLATRFLCCFEYASAFLNLSTVGAATLFLSDFNVGFPIKPLSYILRYSYPFSSLASLIPATASRERIRRQR